MTRDQAAIERRVINAAKQIERAAQYGTNANQARQEYDRAREDQATARRNGGVR